jgi:hypothetical protein
MNQNESAGMTKRAFGGEKSANRRRLPAGTRFALFSALDYKWMKVEQA